VLDTVRKAIAEGDVDFLREGVRVLAQAVMEAGVTEVTGAATGERAPDRAAPAFFPAYRAPLLEPDSGAPSPVIQRG